MSPAEEREIKRREREKDFDRMVREYLADGQAIPRDKRFQFGGGLNLVSAVRIAFIRRFEETGCTDYEKVADELAKVEAMADLCYDEDLEKAA